MECRGGDGALWMVVADVHSAVALEKTLTDPRLRNGRRVINVAVCGGDRDQGMRPRWGLKPPRPSTVPGDPPSGHLSDRTQRGEALRERRKGLH